MLHPSVTEEELAEMTISELRKERRACQTKEMMIESDDFAATKGMLAYARKWREADGRIRRELNARSISGGELNVGVNLVIGIEHDGSPKRTWEYKP